PPAPPVSPHPRPDRSAELRAGHRRAAVAVEEDAREAGRGKTLAGIVSQRGVLDGQGAGVVVADEEDGPAALAGGVVLDHGPVDGQRVLVAVVVDAAAAAAARRARAGRVGAPAEGLVSGDDA